MSKRKAKNPEAVSAIRRAGRREYVDNMRDGRVQRAHTFKDKKKHADKKACRGKVSF